MELVFKKFEVEIWLLTGGLYLDGWVLKPDLRNCLVQSKINLQRKKNP
jgi:hypothetical protein